MREGGADAELAGSENGLHPGAFGAGPAGAQGRCLQQRGACESADAGLVLFGRGLGCGGSSLARPEASWGLTFLVACRTMGVLRAVARGSEARYLSGR